MLLSLGSFTVVDTETTDADPATCRVVEAGAAVFRGGYLSHDASQRVNPGVPMHPEAARITGICDAALAHAPKLAGASIVKMFRDPQLVGYNSEAFDRPVLERELPELPRRPWLDVFVFVSWHLRHLPKRNLCALAAQLKIPMGAAHGAAADARATGAVLLHLVRERMVPDDYAAALAAQAGLQPRIAAEWAKYGFWLYEARDGSGQLYLGAGKHTGRLLGTVPPDYFRFILDKVAGEGWEMTPASRAVFERAAAASPRRRHQTTRAAA